MALNSLSNAVEFGKTVDRGMTGGMMAFPFIYTFVPRDKDTWDQVKNPASLPLNHIDLGPVIPAGGRLDVYVPLDADYIYKLIAVKFSVYAATQQQQPRPTPPPI